MILKLPPEIIIYIIDYLDILDILNLSMTNSTLQYLCGANKKFSLIEFTKIFEIFDRACENKENDFVPVHINFNKKYWYSNLCTIDKFFKKYLKYFHIITYHNLNNIKENCTTDCKCAFTGQRLQCCTRSGDEVNHSKNCIYYTEHFYNFYGDYCIKISPQKSINLLDILDFLTFKFESGSNWTKLLHIFWKGSNYASVTDFLLEFPNRYRYIFKTNIDMMKDDQYKWTDIYKYGEALQEVNIYYDKLPNVYHDLHVMKEFITKQQLLNKINRITKIEYRRSDEIVEQLDRIYNIRTKYGEYIEMLGGVSKPKTDRIYKTPAIYDKIPGKQLKLMMNKDKESRAMSKMGRSKNKYIC